MNENITARVKWIRKVLAEAGAKGVVYGNSGGKDCTLVGILCRMATENVTSIVMPCESKRNFGIDRDHAYLIGEKYGIKTEEIDLTPVKQEFRKVLSSSAPENGLSFANINPRLRMITLYAYAQSHGYLVAGTGNRSEATMGYFTKWGDGAHDFNPIADLTVTEIYAMLRELDCPAVIIEKAPSAGLFEGQTDEGEMGITYAAIDEYLLEGKGTPENVARIERTKKATAHKRTMPRTFPN